MLRRCQCHFVREGWILTTTEVRAMVDCRCSEIRIRCQYGVKEVIILNRTCRTGTLRIAGSLNGRPDFSYDSRPALILTEDTLSSGQRNCMFIYRVLLVTVKFDYKNSLTFTQLWNLRVVLERVCSDHRLRSVIDSLHCSGVISVR